MTVSVLILPRHDVQAASCRHRFVQYVPFLKAHGFECTISPFFSAPYTRVLLSEGRKTWSSLASGLTTRFKQILSARRYDLLVIHAELIPYFPAIFERHLNRVGIPYVLDFDDAFFHQYDRHPSAVVRAVLGSKIASVIRNAALNCAGSEYLAGYARRYSPRVTIVPTVVDLRRYPQAMPAREAGPFRIGWIGSPSTTAHLATVVDELRDFYRRRPDTEILAIGASPFDAGDLPIRWIPWSHETEVEQLARADVGIMPLPQDDWSAGKCAFKLIQSMACWRPVIASPVGENRRIVADGTTGLLAARGEWADALDRLYRDEALRSRLGAGGRSLVEREYSLEQWQPRLAALWAGVASRALNDQRVAITS